jgi:regulator of protease activity HflC (stomatin/prohibitin superfamily)
MSQLILAALFALGVGMLVIAFLGVVLARTNKKVTARTTLLAGLLTAIAIFLTIAIFNSYTVVQAGSVAVVKRFGQVVTVFEPGLNWKAPFIDQTIVYRTQEIVYETSDNPDASNADYTDYQVDTATSDGQQITARYTVRFRIKPQEAANIVNNLGTEPELVEKVVKQNSRVWVRTLLRNYTASQLYSGDIREAQESIASQLRRDFEKEGLELVFFGLRQIGFTDAYKQAVENKQIEAENIITRKNQAEQAKYEKERAITQAQAEAEKQRLERIGVAQGEAESIKLKAQAQAEATLLKAKAQAQANELLAKSLSPALIDWQAVLQWSGQYPTVYSTNGGQQMILPGDLFNLPAEASPTPAPQPTPAP